MNPICETKRISKYIKGKQITTLNEIHEYDGCKWLVADGKELLVMPRWYARNLTVKQALADIANGLWVATVNPNYIANKY